MTLPSWKDNKRRYLSILGGFLIHIMIGTFYLWGNINVYVTSHLRNNGSNVTIDDMNSTFPFSGMAMGLFTPFGKIIADKVGNKRTMIICTICFASCSLLASFQTTFLSFSITYGFAAGMFAGIIYLIPYYFAYSNFPNNKGFASGVISAGFGLSTFIFSWLCYFVINPNNLKPIFNPNTHENYFSKEVSNRVPYMLRILSGLFLFLGTLGCFLQNLPEENEIQQQERGESIKIKIDDQASFINQYNGINECKDIKSGLRTPVVYLTMILILFYGAQGNFIIDNFQPIGQQIGNFSDFYLTIVGSLGSIFNGFIRLIWGRALDKYCFKKLAYLNLSIEFVCMIIFQYCVQYKSLYIISVLLMLGCFGGWSAKMPAVIAKVYGKDIGSTFYGITVQGQAMGCWLQFFIVKYLRVNFGWNNIFYIYSGIIAIAAILTYFANFHINWNEFYAKRQSLKEDLIIEKSLYNNGEEEVLKIDLIKKLSINQEDEMKKQRQ